MSLYQALSAWDLKSASAISDLYDRYSCEEAFVAQIVALMGEAPLQRGAIWSLTQSRPGQNLPFIGAILLPVNTYKSLFYCIFKKF